jgi:hypothetical protein
MNTSDVPYVFFIPGYEISAHLLYVNQIATQALYVVNPTVKVFVLLFDSETVFNSVINTVCHFNQSASKYVHDNFNILTEVSKFGLLFLCFHRNDICIIDRYAYLLLAVRFYGFRYREPIIFCCYTGLFSFVVYVFASDGQSVCCV